jgi:xanthine permease XanP
VILGIGVDVAPEIFHTFPHWLQPVFHSSLSTATILAILLNLIFRIGITSKAGMDTGEPARMTSERLFAFMQRQGGIWGARKEVIDKATAAADEFLQVVREHGLNRRADPPGSALR